MRMQGASMLQMLPRDCHGYDPRRQRWLLKRKVPDLFSRGRGEATAADQGPNGWHWQSPSPAGERCGQRSTGRPRLFDRIGSGRLDRDQTSSPIAVGHRVVHGGPDYDRPVLIDHGVVARLERFVALAPLHQPHNLAPIRSLLANFPALPQVACFDTAFHRTHDAVADYYAIPYQLHAEGVRRYGFHGLSYEYVAKTLLQFSPEIAKGRVIVAHLGSGASMCALKG